MQNEIHSLLLVVKIVDFFLQSSLNENKLFLQIYFLNTFSPFLEVFRLNFHIINFEISPLGVSAIIVVITLQIHVTRFKKIIEQKWNNV